MMPEMQVLRLHAYGEKPEDDMRVTLSAMSIKMVASKDAVIQERPVKDVTILFLDGEVVELYLNEIDLLQLESVIGAYGFLET